MHIDSGAGTLGSKINRGVQKCLDAKPETTHFALFDSDDLHHCTRIQRQIQPLLDDPVLLLTGTSILTYQDMRSGQVWQYRGAPSGWLGGLTFCARGWQRFPLEDKTNGVDSIWQRKFAQTERHDLQDGTLMLCGLGANTCKKNPSSPLWVRLPCVPAALNCFSFHR